MTRLCLILVGLVCSATVTQAQNLPAERSKPVRLHAPKTATAQAAANSDTLTGISFSDPYAPPVGVRKTDVARFPAVRSSAPVEPKGGFSLTAGKDSPDAPFTGGLKIRF
jgi:hypothetical protein